MVTLEQVEKLREYADITYDEAKAALENADGDILQALIDLERQGKVKPPQGGGQYNSGSIEVSDTTREGQNCEGKDQSKHHGGKDHARYHDHHGHCHGNSENESAFHHHSGRFFRWLGMIIHKGNINALIVEKNGEIIMRLPITALVILLLCAFWIIVPLLIIGFFFSFRYYFQGPDITGSKVNDAMDSVADAAEDIKNDMRGQD